MSNDNVSKAIIDVLPKFNEDVLKPVSEIMGVLYGAQVALDFITDRGLVKDFEKYLEEYGKEG